MRRAAIVVSALVVGALSCRKTAERSFRLSELPATPRGLPTAVDPPENPTTPAKVALGAALFFDPLLSKGAFMSCADCHREDHGWAGTEAASVNAMGKRTRRKAPSILNEAYPKAFAWDGRAPTLEAVIRIGWSQLAGDPPKVAADLDAIPEYRAMFTEAFGGPANEERILRALGAYLRALETGDAPYDRFVAGDTGAMSDGAKRGLEKFQRFGCTGCHTPPMFSDYAFHATGVGEANAVQDLGRFETTKVEGDERRFRTPSLREVALSGPWFHDGSAATLEHAIRFMLGGGAATKNHAPTLVAHAATDADVADLRAFLEALTGVRTLQPLVETKTLPGGRPRK